MDIGNGYIYCISIVYLCIYCTLFTVYLNKAPSGGVNWGILKEIVLRVELKSILRTISSIGNNRGFPATGLGSVVIVIVSDMGPKPPSVPADTEMIYSVNGSKSSISLTRTSPLISLVMLLTLSFKTILYLDRMPLSGGFGDLHEIIIDEKCSDFDCIAIILGGYLGTVLKMYIRTYYIIIVYMSTT